MQRLLGTYVDRSGKPAFDGRFLAPTRFEGGVARVTSAQDGRVGVVDREGKPVVPPTYDFIEPFVDGIARTNDGGALQNGVRGGKWGLLHEDGRVLAKPTYDGVLNPDDGRITVWTGGKYGFLDLQGNVVVAPRFAFASWHASGLAAVALEDGTGDGYVDRDGNVVIAGPFQEATAFESGVARVKQNGRWGTIDAKGTVLHHPLYDRVGALRDGACWAVLGAACCILAKDGRVLGDAHFDEARQALDDGIWPVRRGSEWGFLLPDGRVVAMGASGTLGFHKGLGRIQRDGKWGFVDVNGELVIPCRYDDAFGFEEDRAAVKRDGAWTFVDRTGRELGAGGYAHASYVRDGMAAVRIGEHWGYVDRDGAPAIDPRFDWADHFGDGLAAVISVDRSVAVAVPRGDGIAHVLPEGGLTHPIFDGAGRAAHLIAILHFEHELLGAELEALRKRVEAWERVVRPEEKLYTEDKWLTGLCLYVRVQGLADPRADLSLLVDELLDAGTPITEALFARWGTPPGETVMFPNADPRMSAQEFEVQFADFPEYWESVWDTSGPAPVPENKFYLRGAIQTRDSICLEERHAPLWFPDVRICMGALSNQGEQYLPVDEKSQRLAARVRDAIEKRFARTWWRKGTDRKLPRPQVRDGSAGVEPITYEGRRGYAFAIESDTLLHWFSGARMRYREPELMEALREVVLDRELGLAPVILWQRFARQIAGLPMSQPTVVVINVFEPG